MGTFDYQFSLTLTAQERLTELQKIADKGNTLAQQRVAQAIYDGKLGQDLLPKINLISFSIFLLAVMMML